MVEPQAVTVTDDGIATGRGRMPRVELRRLVYDAARSRLSFFDGRARARLTAAVAPEDAERVASALGVVLEERCAGTAGFGLPAALLAVAIAALGLVFLLLRARLGSVLPTLPMMTMGLFAVVMAAFRLRAGVHGVTEARLWMQRHHPYGTIERVDATAEGVILRFRGGAATTFAIGGIMQGSLRKVVAASFARRVEAGILRHRSTATRADVRAALDPGALTPRQWVAQLRALKSDGYRSGRPAEADLWRVLEDPAEAEVSRGAAALLLSSDERQRARVRVAIDDSASPALRDALEAAADDETDRAEEATAALARVRNARSAREASFAPIPLFSARFTRRSQDRARCDVCVSTCHARLSHRGPRS